MFHTAAGLSGRNRSASAGTGGLQQRASGRDFDGPGVGRGAYTYIHGNGKYHALADGRGDRYTITHSDQESHANGDSHGGPHTFAYGWRESLADANVRASRSAQGAG